MSKLYRYSRLKKIAMDMTMFEGTLNQTSQKGREILKALEDFKFTLEQTARLLNNNQEFSQGMIQKRKSVDELSNKLYQIVFDIENIDISEAFQNQQQPVLQDMPTTVIPNNQPKDPQNPVAPGMPPAADGQPPTTPGGPAGPSSGPGPGAGSPPPPSSGPIPKGPQSGEDAENDNVDKEEPKDEENGSE